MRSGKPQTGDTNLLRPAMVLHPQNTSGLNINKQLRNVTMLVRAAESEYWNTCFTECPDSKSFCKYIPEVTGKTKNGKINWNSKDQNDNYITNDYMKVDRLNSYFITLEKTYL